MQKHSIKENEFFPAPGGAGSLNTQPGTGTFSSPDASQNSGAFGNNNNNKAINQNGNLRKDGPDTGSMAKDLNIIYAKRDTPSVDEVAAGIKYELGQQIKKDKQMAKQQVVTNLKKDPHFYSGLKMLNIDDESMVNNMAEAKHPNDGPERAKVTTNVSETKKIFEDLTKQSENKYVVNSEIVNVMKQMWEQKRQRSAWKNGQ